MPQAYPVLMPHEKIIYTLAFSMSLETEAEDRDELWCFSKFSWATEVGHRKLLKRAWGLTHVPKWLWAECYPESRIKRWKCFSSLSKREKEVGHRIIGPIKTVPGKINVLLNRITDFGRDLWRLSMPLQHSTQRGSPRACCSVLCLARHWISPRIETTQTVKEACFSIWPFTII